MQACVGVVCMIVMMQVCVGVVYSTVIVRVFMGIAVGCSTAAVSSL